MNLKESDVEKITTAVNLAKSQSKDLDEYIRRFKNITESSLDKYGYQGLNLMSELFKENFSTATHYINVGKYFFHHSGMFRSDCLVEFISIVKPLGDAGQFTHLVNTAVNFIHKAGLNVEGLDEQNQIDLFCSSATNFCERCATVFSDLELHPKLALLPFMETLSPKGNNPSALDGSKEIELTIGGVLLTLYPSDFNKRDLMATYESFVAYDKNNELHNKETVIMNEKYFNDVIRNFPALGKESNPDNVILMLEKIMQTMAVDAHPEVFHKVLLKAAEPIKDDNFVYRRLGTFLTKSGDKTIIFYCCWLADWCDSVVGVSSSFIKSTVIAYALYADFCENSKDVGSRINEFGKLFSNYIERSYAADLSACGDREMLIYPFLEIISETLSPRDPNDFITSIDTTIGTFNINIDGLKTSLKTDPMIYVNCEFVSNQQPVDLKAVNEHLEERNKQMDNDVAAITENATTAVTEPVVKELSELLFFKKLEGGTYQLELLKQFDNKEEAKALLERITALL